MVGYDDNNNALTLSDDDALRVGDYDLKYSSTDDEWQAEYGRPIGGEAGNHAKNAGTTSYDNNSKVGEYSLKVDGDESVAPHTDEHTYTNITISGWIKLDRPIADMEGGFPAMVEKDSGASDGSFFFGQTGPSSTNNWGIRLPQVDSDNIETDYSPSFNTDVWVHTAATYDGSDLILYEDGSQVSSTTTTTGIQNNTEGIKIGTSWEGNFDDIRIYDRALSPTEINDLSNDIEIQNGLISQWTFEYPETPRVAIDSTGDAFPKNRIPRSTSGSLVPQGLAESVAAGEALADDGNTYSSVQTAVDNASGWVFVGPGTFAENVTVSTAGMTIEGVGYDTLIDGEDSGIAVEATASDVTVSNLRTTTSAGGSYGVSIGAVDNVTVDSVIVDGVDSSGIHTEVGSTGITITNCDINSSDNGISLNSTNSVISNCRATTTESIGLGMHIYEDDNIVANCVVYDTANIGIRTADSNDCIIIGCRVINSDGNGISPNGTDHIIANNRVSDSTDNDIDTGLTGGVQDDNLTGPAN